MSEVQKKHKIQHIPVLKIDRHVLEARFPQGCSMMNCTGKCCLTGVWLDPLDQNRILTHAERVRSFMDLTQEKDSDRWFDEELPADSDFPSGRAVGTALFNGGCVFLNAEKRCVLQKASNEATGNLKPFFCNAFPITLDNGTVLLDEARDPACCTEFSDGPLTIFDICSEELTYVLGEDGVRELQDKSKP